MGAVPFLVGVDGGVVQAGEQGPDAWPVRRCVLDRLVRGGRGGRVAGSPAPRTRAAIARPGRSWSDHPRGCVRRLRAGGLERRPRGAVPPRARRDHLAAGRGAARRRAGGGGLVACSTWRPARATWPAARPREARRSSAVDFSDEMLALAASLHPSVTFQQADAGALPFEDGSFDAVDRELPDAARRRPPRGRGRARARRPPGRPARARHVGPRARRPSRGRSSSRSPRPAPRHPPTSHPARRSSSTPRTDEFAALLRGAGLTDVSVEAIAFTHRVDDLDAFWTDLVGGTVRRQRADPRQPPELQARIRRLYGEKLARWRVDGGWDVACAVKLGAATRT